MAYIDTIRDAKSGLLYYMPSGCYAGKLLIDIIINMPERVATGLSPLSMYSFNAEVAESVWHFICKLDKMSYFAVRCSTHGCGRRVKYLSFPRQPRVQAPKYWCSECRPKSSPDIVFVSSYLDVLDYVRRHCRGKMRQYREAISYYTKAKGIKRAKKDSELIQPFDLAENCL